MAQEIQVTKGVERIEANGTLLAIVIRADVRPDGVRFYTSDDASLQMGLLGHRTGFVAQPHIHHPMRRVIAHTMEMLHMRAGRMEVYVYDQQRQLVSTIDLAAGDTILLMAGGHGLKVTEDALILEVKQGPYLGVDDKEKF
ncbi:MAG: hypothetical protein KKA73_12860 [Chloroflexi bacterium]|nr:hypothetical protein [Chloroflexota bacterium]MBU1748571.1 hypothetical protein [Chloroflexota bacterium]MBU1879862.1 hypothetical protein [Chloroflexota bacterium]